MKSLVKSFLKQLGRLPGLRALWLWLARWTLNTLPLSPGWRDAILWPLATYILGSDYSETVRLRTGPVFHAHLDDPISRLTLFYPGSKAYLWEPQTLRLALCLQPPHGLTLVGGAHVGYHALHLAHRAQTTGGQVVAFEPAGRTFASLKRNHELANLGSLAVEHAALGPHSQGAVSFFLRGMRSSLQPIEGAHSESLPLFSLDDYVRQRGRLPVGLVFLDVEGNELDVLHGAKGLLLQHPHLILEVNRPGLRSSGRAPGDLYAFLFAQGYSVFFIDDDYTSTHPGADSERIVLRPVKADDERLCPNLRAFNVVAVQNPDALRQPGIDVRFDNVMGA
jgi:FkbM family methyltransferase